jgi:hypothetical protein
LHNESATIADKLSNNLFALDYPRERWKDRRDPDGSDDGTSQHCPGVHGGMLCCRYLVAEKYRRSMRQADASGEILCFRMQTAASATDVLRVLMCPLQMPQLAESPECSATSGSREV